MKPWTVSYGYPSLMPLGSVVAGWKTISIRMEPMYESTFSGQMIPNEAGGMTGD
jgi:hypothetical protein